MDGFEPILTPAKTGAEKKGTSGKVDPRKKRESTHQGEAAQKVAEQVGYSEATLRKS